MERFLFCCLFLKKMMYEEVISANDDNLWSNYSPETQSFKKLLELIFNYHVFKSRQYRSFFGVFLRAPVVNMSEAVFSRIIIYNL